MSDFVSFDLLGPLTINLPIYFNTKFLILGPLLILKASRRSSEPLKEPISYIILTKKQKTNKKENANLR